ncbi:RNA-directed DNA polymerase [Qipengyuania sp. Mu-71]|jgi:hypothetical protein|uniref:RNA-directed DNA polymerase n=1 Tax=Qipengyuania sp. Mu-71 TaxID=3121477 RepID=UPI002FE4753C
MLYPFEIDRPPQHTDFVTKGLLPANLPSVISSASLAQPYLPEGNRYLVTQNRVGKTAPFDATKRGEQRRSFQVPHPLFARDAGLFIENNWAAIWSHINASMGSASKPMRPASHYRATAMTSQNRLREIRIQKLAAKRFCLVTDVARCFPSVYTHSIPWALHGKQAAKQDRRQQSAEVWGNKLDFIHRQAQDGQTIGLPVGPDASRVTAEIILASVDAEYLQATRTKTSFVRHVDDYWIGGDSIDDCEKSLNVLRRGLGSFGLDINEAKTRIVELSEVTGSYWPDDLASKIEEVFKINAPWVPGRRVQRGEVNDLFSRSINIVRETEDTAILKFLLRKMDTSSIWSENWKKVEPFLAHIAVQFPHVFDYVARILAWAIRREVSVDRTLWREVVGAVAKTSADFGRDGELLWAFWLYKELGFKVPRPIIAKAILSSGPLPLALAVHMASAGLVTNPDFFSSLRARVCSPDMYAGSDWPLLLEIFVVGEGDELQRQYPLDGSLMQKPFAENSSIVRYDAYPEVFYEDREDRQDFEIGDEFDFPDHAIEDFTSSYDDEDEDEDEDGNNRFFLDDDEPF